MKKLLLTLMGVLIALPGLARDFAYAYEGQTLTYTVLDEDAKTCMTKEGELRSSNYSFPGNTVREQLIIPAVVSDGNSTYSVISIGNYGFYKCNSLTSVVIPNSVTSIGISAFHGCSNLESVSISNTVTNIGDFAFYECSSLSSLTIPNSVTTIGDYAFSSCTGLTSIIIPDAVTSIGDYAFSSCKGLTSIIIPNSVTSIGQNVFSSCSGLIKSAYPSNLQNPFSNGVAVAYPYDNAVIENGWITDLNTKAIYFVPVSFEGEYTISSSDIYIGNNAFAGCNGLTSVKCLSTEPPTMHDDSFSGLYDSVKLELYYSSIHNFLPTNWSQFKNINFIDSDSKLSTYETGNLKYILIPAQSKEEKNLAIVIPGDYASLQEITIPERISHPENETIVRYYVDAIGFKAFTGCSNLKTVNFNSRNSSKVIGDYAFAGTGITEITIPGNIKTIGNRAFYGVGNLRSLTLNEGTESIGDEAFCTSIIQSGGNPIYMPSSIKVIGRDAFKNLPISRVNIPNLSTWCNIQFKGPYSNPMARSGNLYVNNEEVKELKIPDNVTEIKSYAFINGTNLTSVTLNPSVQSIGTRAFADCMQIKSISIPGNVIQIGKAAFTCGYLDRLSGTFTDPSTSELRKVTLEYGTDIIEIEKDAFPSISQLICNRPLDGIEIKTTQLWNLSIGNNVTKIPASKFKGAKYLTSLSLGNSIKIIEDEAFSGCSRLKEVIIPPSVEVIGASAFAGASNLSSIIMGPNVKNIDEKAYDLCPASTVSITAQTPPVAPDNTFSNYTGVLYVQGQTTVDAYYDADYCWHQFEGIVMIEPTGIDMGNSPTNLMGKPGDSFQLTATLVPADVTLPHVFWRSTNPAIATVDNNGLVTLHADTSEVMAAAEDGNGTTVRSCKIVAESLYTNGPVAEVTVTDMSTPTGIGNMFDNGESGDIDFDALIEVYTLQGVRVSDRMKNLVAGVYIVRQGKNIKKILVK